MLTEAKKKKGTAHKRRSECPLPSKPSTVESTEIKCVDAADSSFSAAEWGVQLEPTRCFIRITLKKINPRMVLNIHLFG